MTHLVWSHLSYTNYYHILFCFILFHRCAGTAVFKTRCIAARALVAVVPKGNVPDMLKQLLETLPGDPPVIGPGARSICHNYIHGVLLQVMLLAYMAIWFSN